MVNKVDVIHHGAVDGVTGSCHELRVWGKDGILIDCGLFQGSEASSGHDGNQGLAIDFPIEHIRALVVTHCHIDHVGRIPHLFAAGFDGPIYCSEPSAILLPLVLKDAVKVGVTRDQSLIARFVKLLESKIIPVPYGQLTEIPLPIEDYSIWIKLQRAGHILGSCYVECDIKQGAASRRVIFSGDLGAPHAPLLPPPRSPYAADVLVLESTYGDRVHEGRKIRKQKLSKIVERCLKDLGVILIPAFSIGRTQELLYEFEDIIHSNKGRFAAKNLPWEELDVIVDSPLANRFTKVYQKLKTFWDQEARTKLAVGRHPLSFEQLTTVGSHGDHLSVIDHLKNTGRPSIVIAASGMCSGGRIVNYLKALIEDSRTDILFVGYQAKGTPGRTIQKYGSKNGYVNLEGKTYDIKASVHTLSGYSAHADQPGLIRFVKGMHRKPGEIRIVHGQDRAKVVLKGKLKEICPHTNVLIP